MGGFLILLLYFLILSIYFFVCFLLKKRITMQRKKLLLVFPLRLCQEATLNPNNPSCLYPNAVSPAEFFSVLVFYQKQTIH